MFDLTWTIRRTLKSNGSTIIPGELEPARDPKGEADQHGGGHTGLTAHLLLHPVLQDCSKRPRFHSQSASPLLLGKLVSVREHCVGVGNAQLKAEGGVVTLGVPNLN